MKARELRKKYPTFTYKGYSYEVKDGDLEMAFDFRLGQTRFSPRVVIKNVPAKSWLLSPTKQPILENLVFHLGLAEMPSYWKVTASPRIIVEAGNLNKTQINWWHDLFTKGMGEYFYKNNIDFRSKNFLTIESGGPAQRSFGEGGGVVFSKKTSNKTLVPIGGGKDAVVTYEILKRAKQAIKPFVLNPTNAQKALLRKMKEGSAITVQRTIDPKLLELNREGYLNGHTPFSSYLAFLTTLCAALFDYKYIALSNERSSNEGNVQYLGHEINHQYSKSFEFEKKFRIYSKKYLTENIEYFSFLRPLYELQIAKLFAQYPQYFGTFLSCNEAHKTHSGRVKATGKWCGACSKCLFVFLVLSPFAREKTLRIFKKDLLQDKELKPLLDELTGKRGFKPFECVGTTKESRAALELQTRKDHPLLHAWNNKHFLPRNLEKALRSMLQ